MFKKHHLRRKSIQARENLYDYLVLITSWGEIRGVYDSVSHIDFKAQSKVAPQVQVSTGEAEH